MYYFIKSIKTILIFGVFFTPFFSYAQEISSIAEGEWNDMRTWKDGVIPTEVDDVIIKSNVKFKQDASLKLNSLTINSDWRLTQNLNLELNEDFKITENGSLDILKEGVYTHWKKLNLKAKTFVNEGKIKNKSILNIDADFINKNNIDDEVELLIKQNNLLVRNIGLEKKTNNYFILNSNTENNQYYIYGKEINLKLNDTGDKFFFKGDLNIDKLTQREYAKIFLNNNQKIKINEYDNLNLILIDNKNNNNLKVILNKTRGSYPKTEISLPDSDLWIKGYVGNIKELKVKNLYLEAVNFSFKEKNNIEINGNLIISKKTTCILNRNIIKAKNIINYGKIYIPSNYSFPSTLISKNAIQNYGEIDTKDRLLKIQGDIYNYEDGVFTNRVSILPKNDLENNNQEIKFGNKGKIKYLNLINENNNDFNFKKVNFDFSTNFNSLPIILNSDTTFSDWFINLQKIISKENKELNLLFSSKTVAVGDWEKFNLYFKNKKDEKISIRLNDKSKFNKIVNLGKLEFYDIKDDWIFDKDIINNKDGIINFKKRSGVTKYYFNKTIFNQGKIEGGIYWTIDNSKKFKYLITDKRELSEIEKNDLKSNKSWVNKTADVVEKLNDDKSWYIFWIKESENGKEEEIQFRVLKSRENIDIKKVEDFEEKIDFPDKINISAIPNIGDKTAPDLRLNGASEINLIQGEAYTELGARANDNIDGNLIDKILITQSPVLDTNIIGRYEIKYEVSDLVGNKTVKTRVVIVSLKDIISPVITLNGDSRIELHLGDVYQELGATALDESDGDITNQIQITNNIDLTKLGTYIVSYTVFDDTGNQTIKERVVDVVEKAVVDSSKGKSGKKTRRAGGGSDNIYSCKDSGAINFSNIGIHKENLCVWKKEGGEEKAEDFASQNPPQQEEKALSDEELKKKAEELLKKLEEEKKEEKEKEKEEKILLKSTCLKIQSKEKVLKKNTKDRKNTIKLQSFLKKYKYLNGRVDGAFGAITKSSFQNFQKDNKLYSDGILGVGTIKWIDKNCKYIQNKKEEEKGQKKENEKKKKVEDFAPQSPPQKTLNLEKKEKIISKEIQKIKEELEGKKENWKKEKKKIENRFSDLHQRAFSGNWASDTLLAPSYVLMRTGGKITEGVKSYANAYSQGWTITKKWAKEKWSGNEEKEFFFKIHNNTAKKEKHNSNKEIVIIIHGWNSAPKDWVINIAKSLDNQQREILLLDWQEITGRMNILDDTIYTEDVAKKLAIKLNKWRIERNKTTIIGHSMGAMLASRISYHLGKVKTLIALDTAQFLGSKYKWRISQKGDKFKGYRDVAQNTKCFVGSASLFGYQDMAETCDQTYVIDFPEKKSTLEHKLVHKIYRDILNGNTLYNNILTPQNTTYILSGKMNVDKINNDFKLTDLKIEKGNRKIVYGTEVDNEFSCEDGWIKKEKDICEFYGWKGDDEYYQENTDFVIKDFKEFRKDKNKIDNDKLFVKNISKDNVLPVNNGVYLKIDFKDWKLSTKTTYVFLEGVNEDQVKGWIKQAKKEDGLIDDEDYEKLSIQIK